MIDLPLGPIISEGSETAKILRYFSPPHDVSDVRPFKNIIIFGLLFDIDVPSI
jgi:hypothetical protein